jgi:hypothetical protein
MKVTVKKNLIIFHSVHEFEDLFHRLLQEHGRSTMMISWKLKRELGFTIRNHKGLAEHDKDTWEVMKSEGFHNRYHYEMQVHLDFYNEAQQTFFVLKYLNN